MIAYYIIVYLILHIFKYIGYCFYVPLCDSLNYINKFYLYIIITGARIYML